MIIDFHTHTYPKNLTRRVISSLSATSGVSTYTDATDEGLVQSALENHIDHCILLPVATSVRQTEKLNRIALDINDRGGILCSFGAIHPDNDDYREVISSLAAHGIKGLKLHPVFQNTPADDIRYKRIIDCTCEHGMIMSIHAGPDISNPDNEASYVRHIRSMLMDVRPEKMILAHMGGHFAWDEAEDMLGEYISLTGGQHSLYLDTAFCLPTPDVSPNIHQTFMAREQFLRMVRLIGADHVLFGTDSPWTSQRSSIEALQCSGLTEAELALVLGENAVALLG